MVLYQRPDRALISMSTSFLMYRKRELSGQWTRSTVWSHDWSGAPSRASTQSFEIDRNNCELHDAQEGVTITPATTN